jgi:hypothetical protein
MDVISQVASDLQIQAKFPNKHMKRTDFEWLQDWYYSQCDGDWEHGEGIKIQTLDNPGWLVLINLDETELEDVHFPQVKEDFSEDNWISCLKREKKFQGAGDPQKLTRIIQIFKEWALSNTNQRINESSLGEAE